MEGKMFNYSELEQVAARYEERLRKAEAEHRARESNQSEAPLRSLRPLEWTFWILGFQIYVRSLGGGSTS
jgi:hypothetical protein